MQYQVARRWLPTEFGTSACAMLPQVASDEILVSISGSEQTLDLKGSWPPSIDGKTADVVQV